MTTFRNNIQRVNNSNSIVYNGNVYVERDNGRGAIARTLSDKKPGERMGYIIDGERMAAINEPNGWLLEDIISFDDAFNHYIKGHCSLDEATSIVWTQSASVLTTTANGQTIFAQSFANTFVTSTNIWKMKITLTTKKIWATLIS